MPAQETREDRIRLTAKQEAFARLIALGDEEGVPLSQAEAYRRVYDTTSGKIATEEASKLVRHPQVAQMVERLKAEVVAEMRDKAVSVREEVAEHLRLWMKGEGRPSPQQVRAAELLGKTVGMFRDVVETDDKHRDSEDLLAELNQKLESLLGGAENAH